MISKKGLLISWIVTIINIILFTLNFILLGITNFDASGSLNDGLGIVIMALIFIALVSGSLIFLGVASFIKIIITAAGRKRKPILIISLFEYIIALIASISFLYIFISLKKTGFIINSALILINNIVGIILMIKQNKKSIE